MVHGAYSCFLSDNKPCILSKTSWIVISSSSISSSPQASPIKASNKSSSTPSSSLDFGIRSKASISSRIVAFRSLKNGKWLCFNVGKVTGFISFPIIPSSCLLDFSARICVLFDLSAIGTSFDIYGPLIAIFIISY
jgi:hypothetical protein